MNCPIQASGNKVVLKKIEEETKTPGGLILPDSDKKIRFKVVSVGKGKLLADGSYAEIEASVDDIVLIGKYSGHDITINGQEYVIVNADEIIAIFV